MPRTMPSVGSMLTQRTRFSPRCCSTSAITSIGLSAVAAGVVDADRLVDGRDVLVELHVHHGADDLDDATDVRLRHDCLLSYEGAPAPETTSMISLVIAAWRTLFM